MHSILTIEDNPDPSFALMAAGAPDYVDQRLMEINVEAVEDQNHIFAIIKEEVERLKTSAPNRVRWQLRLDTLKGETMQDLTSES